MRQGGFQILLVGWREIGQSCDL
uniref:Uncharacterized protein n=1 Tax=Rhizophora mucronata TaxID=61149 RepID=A0A2P2ISP9_RHIMU